MDLARRTRIWARSPEQAQHPFVQVPHGAWHPTSDKREICVCHSLHNKPRVAWVEHRAPLTNVCMYTHNVYITL